MCRKGNSFCWPAKARTDCSRSLAHRVGASPVSFKLKFSNFITVFSGTSSDCGSDGQSLVQADGGVEFNFRNSVYSNNGTDVEGGQIPELYYKVRSTASTSNLRLSTESDTNQQQVMDRQAVSMLASVSLSAQTVFAITAESIRHVFRVLEWAIRSSFQLKDYDEMQDDVAAARQERAAFVAIVSLRMIRYLH